MNEIDAFELFTSLGNYLKTEIKISFGIVEKLRRHGVKVQEEGHTATITVSNTAPLNAEWPLIVFNGVGIAFNPKKYNNSTIMTRNTNYKVDLSNAPQGGGWDLLGDKQRFQKVNVGEYPMITSDEQSKNIELHMNIQVEIIHSAATLSRLSTPRILLL